MLLSAIFCYFEVVSHIKYQKLKFCFNFSNTPPFVYFLHSYRRKATKDLEWHLWNLRSWVWDAPNVKAVFKNTMN